MSTQKPGDSASSFFFKNWSLAFNINGLLLEIQNFLGFPDPRSKLRLTDVPKSQQKVVKETPQPKPDSATVEPKPDSPLIQSEMDSPQIQSEKEKFRNEMTQTNLSLTGKLQQQVYQLFEYLVKKKDALATPSNRQ